MTMVAAADSHGQVVEEYSHQKSTSDIGCPEGLSTCDEQTVAWCSQLLDSLENGAQSDAPHGPRVWFNT